MNCILRVGKLIGYVAQKKKSESKDILALSISIICSPGKRLSFRVSCANMEMIVQHLGKNR